MSGLKVLIPVDHAVGISGPHRNVVGSLNALGARDDVEVVLLTGKIDATEPYARAQNIDIRLGYQPSSHQRLLANIWSAWRAARGCDVIYVPSGLKSFLYAQPVRPGRRLVAGPNVTPLPLGKRPDSPGVLELKYLSNAWFEASRARRDHVRRVTGDTRVGYIHHAIDTSKFAPEHRQAGLWRGRGVPDDAVKVLFVGRDNKKLKGVSQLVDAIEILNKRGYGHLQYIFVGIVSDVTMERFRSMPNVTVDGFKTGQDLAAAYASADMSVVPSSWEGFGFTVLEAQASGIPVIGSNGGAIPEIVADGDTGIIADIVQGTSHRPDAGNLLADAIMTLADDAERRMRFGANARRRVLEHFSERRLGDDLMAIFRGDRLTSRVAGKDRP